MGVKIITLSKPIPLRSPYTQCPKRSLPQCCCSSHSTLPVVLPQICEQGLIPLPPPSRASCSRKQTLQPHCDLRKVGSGQGLNLNAWLLTSPAGCAPCACGHLEHGVLSNQPRIPGLSPPIRQEQAQHQVRRTSGLSLTTCLYPRLSSIVPLPFHPEEQSGNGNRWYHRQRHSESCKWGEGRGEENSQQQTQQPGQHGNDLLQCLFLTLLSLCTVPRKAA